MARQKVGPIKCIIFDFDGTLVGGMSIWIHALRQTLSYFGVKVTSNELQKEFRSSFTNRMPGPPWKKIFRHLLPYRYNEAWPLFFETLDRTMVNVDLPPKFRMFLETARSQGVKMGIVTFRSRESVEKMLSRMKASYLFDIIIVSGDSTEEKPSPQPFLLASEKMNVKPGECIVVGDEPIDMIGGFRARMRTIGVLGGSSNRKMLKKAGANLIVESTEKLCDILTDIG